MGPSVDVLVLRATLHVLGGVSRQKRMMKCKTPFWNVCRKLKHDRGIFLKSILNRTPVDAWKHLNLYIRVDGDPIFFLSDPTKLDALVVKSLKPFDIVDQKIFFQKYFYHRVKLVIHNGIKNA